MPVTNARVAELLTELADLLEIQGEMTFKVRAYRRAAQTIAALTENVETLATEGRLEEIPGIGEGIAKKITEIVQTGDLRRLAEERKKVPRGVADLVRLPNVGPKKALKLYQELKVTSVAELKKACLTGKVRGVAGFGEKTEQAILKSIEFMEKSGQRVLLSKAMGEADPYLAHVRGLGGVKEAGIAGSLRRQRETIGDIDILVSAPKSKWDGVLDGFVSYGEVGEVLVKGETKSSVRLRSGLQVDLRVVEPSSYGAALMYFTGSKDHNIALRALALKKGYSLSEWGAFKKGTEKKVAGKSEEEMYDLLGLDYIEPELRENRGEIGAAAKKALPKLIEESDIQGDLHVHTDWTDGREPLEAMVTAAARAGRKWLGISDHTAGLAVTNGLDDARLRKQIDRVRRLSEKGPLPLLVGVEANIGKSGEVDTPPKHAKDLDYVIGSVHSHFTLDAKEQTARVLTAIDSGAMTIFGHPSGRLIGQREAIDLDWEQVFQHCREAGVALELNCFPNRLDLNGEHAKAAKEHKCTFAINTDAHAVDHLRLMPFGVAQARRGWLEAKDVLNTQPPGKVARALAR